MTVLELLKTLSPVRAPGLLASRFVVSEQERYALVILQDAVVPGRKLLGIYDTETWERAELTVRGTGLTLETGPNTPDGKGNWVAGGAGETEPTFTPEEVELHQAPWSYLSPPESD